MEIYLPSTSCDPPSTPWGLRRKWELREVRNLLSLPASLQDLSPGLFGSSTCVPTHLLAIRNGWGIAFPPKTPAWRPCPTLPCEDGCWPPASSQVPGSADRGQEELAFEGASTPFLLPSPCLHPVGTGSSLLNKSKFYCWSVHHPPLQNVQPPAPVHSPGAESTGHGQDLVSTEGTSQRRPPGPGDLERPRSTAMPGKNLHIKSFTPITRTPQAANLPQLILHKSREVFSVLLAHNWKYLKA